MTTSRPRRSIPVTAAARVAADQLRVLAGNSAPDALFSEIEWSGRVRIPLVDESAVQAACGIMHVHGRAEGRPQRIGIDYASTLAGVLAAQGVLAASIARARGIPLTSVRTSVAEAALLAVRQYLAVADTQDEGAERWNPGGRPPLTSRDGVRFELETLYAEGWQRFWQELGAGHKAVAEGWWPFQQRFATASGSLPAALHLTARATDYASVAAAAESVSGVSVLPVREDPVPPVEAPACDFRTLAGTGPRQSWPTGNAPLDGLVVVESTRRIQGPLVGHVLRMLGAEVIRVEPPGGDPMRGVPPIADGCSVRFRALNDGKRAVELDITSEAGRHDLRELVADADAFVHNWAPGKAERWGLDAEDLARVRPGLVYAWSSGWAPLSWPDPPLGTDYLVQAHSGLAAAVYSAGEPSAPSLMTLTDVLGGLVCAMGVLAALLRRERTGEGTRVDSSLYSAAGVIPRPGHRPRFSELERPIRTEDGYLVLPNGIDRAVLAGPLDSNVRSTPAALAARLRTAPTDVWTARLADAGVVATPVCTDLRTLRTDGRFDAALTGGNPVVPPWEFS